MNEYPIEGLMNTAMNSIKDMVDVNTIIGNPIETTNNIVVIPVSKVNFGFVAGGTEFNGNAKKNNSLVSNKDEENKNYNSRMPFGGGSGAGVSISPIAFIVIQQSGVKLLPIDHSSALDKLLDFMPDLMEKTKEMISKKLDQMSQEKSNLSDENSKNPTKEDLANQPESTTSKHTSNKKEQIVATTPEVENQETSNEYDYEYEDKDM